MDSHGVRKFKVSQSCASHDLRKFGSPLRQKGSKLPNYISHSNPSLCLWPTLAPNIPMATPMNCTHILQWPLCTTFPAGIKGHDRACRTEGNGTATVWRGRGIFLCWIVGTNNVGSRETEEEGEHIREEMTWKWNGPHLLLTSPVVCLMNCHYRLGINGA